MKWTVLRTLRDVGVLVVLALLPWLAAGCAADRARGSEHHRPVPYQPPTADTTTGTPPGMAEAPPGFRHETTGAPAARQAPLTGAARPRGGLSYLVPPSSMPAVEEELWVIQKNAKPQSAEDGEVPGSGAMVVPRGGAFVPVPLKHTDVKGHILGHVATVDVTQQFHNPYDGKIEAVYVFPLPHNAAVNEFVMTVGERRIRGIIREREEAKQIYTQAKGQGYVASLLEQDRPNVFTQKVANIEPGKQIDVSVRYFHTLSYSDGWYEWVFPMVVGPRFNPPGTIDGIRAAPRGVRGASGQDTEVQYLKPGERSGHDVAVSVTLDALVPVEAVESRSHQVKVNRTAPARAEVTLDAANRIPNRDFGLRWKVAGEGIRSGMIAQRGKDGGGYFAMTIVPPAELERLPRSPVEMVFTLDVSGSMSGRPIEQAKAAVKWALRHMRPDDTFQVVRFASRAEVMAERPVAASPENVRRAMQYLDGTGAGGGTMMLEGLRTALSGPADESRQRYVVFLTDGYIGNEAEILGALQRTLGDARVFSMAVGSSPNRYLLEHIAKLGRGAVAYLGVKDNAEEVMAAYFAAVSHPVLSELTLDFASAEAAEVYPRPLPDLFVGRPVTVVGRFSGEPPTVVKVRGTVRGEEQAVDVPVTGGGGDGAAEGAADSALPAVWARMKIADLGDRLAVEPGSADVVAQVRRVALEHGLMSAYTAFVAVDSMTRTAGDHGTTVATPVPVPEGVRYETTVRE